MEAVRAVSPTNGAEDGLVGGPATQLVAEIAGLIDVCLAGVTERVDRLLGDAHDRTLGAVMVELERLRRGIEATSVNIVADVDRRGIYLNDGHRRPRNWLLATVRVSGPEAAQRARTARLVQVVPAVAELLAGGRIGVAQAGELARAYGNPRIRDMVVEHVDALVEWALNDDYVTFSERLREWERLADADGAHRDAEHSHRHRDTTIHTVGDATYLQGRFGNLHGAALKEVFEAFCSAEYHADVAEARQRLGIDLPRADMLVRTPAQRRADAFHNLVMTAATAPLDGKTIDVCVNIVIDETTFETALADLVDPLHLHPTLRELPPPACGTDPTDVDDLAAALRDALDRAIANASERTTGQTHMEHDDASGASAGSPLRRFCTLGDGSAIDPYLAARFALIAHVRRIVIGSDGVIIDLGRRERVFRGGARDAAILQAVLDRRGRCIWPACGRTHHCQIDHTTAWTHGGPTTIDNSGPACTAHNLIKTHGYTCRRDEHGRWHTYRPDSTEILAA